MGGVNWLGRVALTYAAVDGSATALNALGLIVAVRAISVEEFGLADLFRTLHTFMPPLLSLNVFASACRFYFDTEDWEERRRILGGALTLQLLVGCATMILLGLSHPVWHRYVNERITREAVWLAALGVPTTSLIASLRQTAIITGMVIQYAFLSLSQASLTVAGILIFVVWWKGGLEGYLLALVLASLGAGVVGYILQADQYRLGPLLKPYGRYAHYGAPFAVSGGIQYGFVLFLRVMLARLASPEALGFYALAERMQLPLAIAVTAAGKAWHPWVLRERPASDEPIDSPVRQLNGMVLLVTGALIIFLREVIALVGGERYAPAHGAALLLLLAAWILFLGDWIVSVSLVLAKRSRPFVLAYAVGYGFGGLVAAAAIPRYGAEGGASTVLLAAALILISMLVIGRAVYPLQLRIGRLILYSCLALGVAVVGDMQGAVWVKVLVFLLYILVLRVLGLVPRLSS